MDSRFYVFIIVSFMAFTVLSGYIYFTNNDAEQRYINVYDGDEPEWFPEEELSIPEDLDSHTYEVTRYPDEEPTEEDLDAAWELYNETYEAVEEHGWFDVENATDDGYISAGRHYVNPDYYLENDSLNPDRPEFLVFYEHPDNTDEKVLAGVMYEDIHTSGEQVAGPLTVWHYHPLEPAVGVGIGSDKEDRERLFEETEFDGVEDVHESILGGEGDVMKYISGEMIHIWFVDHPEGPFGTGMSVPQSSLEDTKKMSKEEFRSYVMEAYNENFGEWDVIDGDRASD